MRITWWTNEERTFLGKGGIAVVTGVWFESRVEKHMLLEVGFFVRGTSLTAQDALFAFRVVLLIKVSQNVNCRHSLRTLATAEFFWSSY